MLRGINTATRGPHGRVGLIPHWAKDTEISRQTYNARSETVDEKPSFRDAWRRAQHCIIPADWIYEPDWRSGKAVPRRSSGPMVTQWAVSYTHLTLPTICSV